MKSKKTNKDPFKNLVLDEYEQELESAFERGEYKPVSKEEFEKTKKMLQEAASNTLAELRKSQSITLRVKQVDLLKLKARAKKKNIPYQTLLGALIRDFVEGKYSLKL